MGYQTEIDFPVLGEMNHQEMKDQKESQKDPGDPLQKPAVGTPFSGFLMHNACSFEEVNGLKLKTNITLLLLSQSKNLFHLEQKSTKKL